jgi:hypothetical protein
MTEKRAEPSDECRLAQEDKEYGELHDLCSLPRSVPLVHGGGILLARKCGCSCHTRR